MFTLHLQSTGLIHSVHLPTVRSILPTAPAAFDSMAAAALWLLALHGGDKFATTTDLSTGAIVITRRDSGAVEGSYVARPLSRRVQQQLQQRGV